MVGLRGRASIHCDVFVLAFVLKTSYSQVIQQYCVKYTIPRGFEIIFRMYYYCKVSID